MHRTREIKYRLSTAEFVGSFYAMASPCEVLIQTSSEADARAITDLVCGEAARLEKKYSRYRDDNIIHAMHQHEDVIVDEETARLLDFAQTAHELSDGRFDITSGILRRLWTFKEGAKVPSRASVKELMPFIGLDKIHWDGGTIRVPEGMEVDFGGFVKEYAVDMALELVGKSYDCPVLVNFGGDLAANKGPVTRESWSVGVRQEANDGKAASFRFQSGAIATSGNRYQFLYYKGNKLSHILNPHTGWPVSHAADSVSVAMNTCLEAGFLSTLASLMGKDAEAFLEAQEVEYWVQRG